jgi:cell division protein FtsB
MSCDRHCYESDIATLEQENRQMRARMDRLQEENTMLIKQVDALLLMVKSNEADRLKVIQEVWQNTMEKNG